MTVKELMARLAELDSDLVVRVADTWWQGEGYGEDWHDLDGVMPTMDVVVVHADKGYVSLVSEEDWDA